MAGISQDRRAGRKQKNKEIADYYQTCGTTWAGEKSQKKQKNKEIDDWQLWHNVAREKSRRTDRQRIADWQSFYFKLIFGSYYFCFVQFSLFPMPKRKRGITGDVASRREAIRKRERRVVETEEERSRRLSTMAQRGQDRRAEETEEQRNS
ncbi:hypothetical protein AVEN_176122-1 [Araneus ventricosus]|uniref:Uncharacterized protein n=1 Tax=Araneus ventricosus TaxID=182803 RepID=A0A4Y2TA97_ARAVE|nr:hypothetical protein AVEN_176122-1 [Araneus ventricosus]